MYREWLIESLEKTRKSQAELARATGIAHAIINRMVLGKRAIRDHEIVTISKALGILPPAVPKGKRDAQMLEVELIPVVGVAQEGVWRDKMSAAPRPMRTELPCPPSPEFAGLRKAVQIIGTNEGDDDTPMPVHSQFVVFIPMEHMKRALRDGDHVYAEVTDGRFHQFTILRCVMKAGKVGTFQSVYNPTSQPASSDKVKVLGVVDATFIQHRNS